MKGIYTMVVLLLTVSIAARSSAQENTDRETITRMCLQWDQKIESLATFNAVITPTTPESRFTVLAMSAGSLGARGVTVRVAGSTKDAVFGRFMVFPTAASGRVPAGQPPAIVSLGDIRKESEFLIEVSASLPSGVTSVSIGGEFISAGPRKCVRWQR